MKLLRSGLLAALFLAWGLCAPVRAEQLTVGGTGSAGPLAQLLFEEFRKQAPGLTLRVIDPPLGTGGALKALAAGRIDLALAGRPLEPAEAATLGRHFELAGTPFVLATPDGQRQAGFSLDHLAEVYEGRLTHWDSGAPIRLVLRPEFDADSRQLKSLSPAMSRAMDAAAKRPGMAVAINDLDAARLIAATPGALGPCTLGLLATLGLRLKALPLNGVVPSLEALRSGSYPWRKTVTVVLPARPHPAAERFAAFLHSPRAREIMLRNDYLPTAP